ncbi:LysM peptidoglycan-binding domain-containing protein [Aliikangiella sp. IMCC44359]|uniref:LysM peptidoglycan-binding domain-containing protein n=1 Tax=Aliikangiella sp. IMCC44359 TaxID=3459125 RepID=UPI00403B2605
MLAFYQRIIIVTLSVALLSSCELLPTNKTTTSEKTSSKSNQSALVESSISLLEQGQYSKAQTIIQRILQKNKQHSIANLLNKQLVLSPKALFNTSRETSYTVKAGDTLGGIAESWLGNSLYFVSLAKLNNIAKPLSLQPGEVIIIPVTPSSGLFKKEQKRSKANLALINQYKTQKDYYKGLEKANSLFIADKDSDALLKIQNEILNAVAMSAASLSERSAMLKKVTQLSQSSRHDAQKSVYNLFIKKQYVSLYLDESVLLFEDESYVESAEKLVQAKKLHQEYSAQSNSHRMETLLLNKLHEQAVVLYRNHELKQAMVRWNLILQIQPGNELAQKYTQRTQKLLKKLNQY